jgi:hypothetical protein
MKKKIKLFSDEDGTKFGQDVRTILANLKVHLQKWGGPAQQIIGAIKFVSEQIKEGTPTDAILDKLFMSTEFEFDEKLYHYLQENLPLWLKVIESKYRELSTAAGLDMILTEALVSYETESVRHKTAAVLLRGFADRWGAQLEQFESDYVIQNVYTILKKAE